MPSSDHKHVFSSKVINSETKATYLKGKSTKFTKFFRELDSQGISAYAIRTRACSHLGCNAVRHYLDIRLPQVKKILARLQEGDEGHAQMSKMLSSQEQRIRKLCKTVRSLKEQVAVLKRAIDLRGKENSDLKQLIDVIVKTAKDYEDEIEQLNEQNYELRSKIDHERLQYQRLIDVSNDEELY